MPSGGEWLWIVLVIIIFFGGKKIPELAKGLGQGMREFKDAKDGIQSEIEAGMKGSTEQPVKREEKVPSANSQV
jgi:sec-independent protein translocase protein TatA